MNFFDRTSTGATTRRYLVWLGVSVWIASGVWMSLEWVSPKEKVPVIVYLVDTLRADRVGAFGYGRPTSPNISALAKESVVFQNAYAASPWTLPSVASLFTSKYICEHGVVAKTDGLNPNIATLATILRDEGYITASIHGSDWLEPGWGLDNGFEIMQRKDNFDNERVAEAMSVIDVAGDLPFFLYIHTMEPHDTYWIENDRAINIQQFMGTFGQVGLKMRKEWKATQELFTNHIWSDWENNADEQIELMGLVEAKADIFNTLYDTSVLIADDNFGKFVEMLKEKGIWDRAITIFLSDHGEEIGDHEGWFHGQTVYEELAHVPLMIHFPEGEYGGKTIDDPVSIVDIMPTILDFQGLEKSCTGCRGSSLWNLLEKNGYDGESSERVVQIYRRDSWDRFQPHADIRGYENIGLRKQNWKGILNINRGKETLEMELYDLNVDPDEKLDVVSNEVGIASELRKYAIDQLNVCLASVEHTAAPATPDEETQERLKALGYLN